MTSFSLTEPYLASKDPLGRFWDREHNTAYTRQLFYPSYLLCELMCSACSISLYMAKKCPKKMTLIRRVDKVPFFVALSDKKLCESFDQTLHVCNIDIFSGQT